MGFLQAAAIGWYMAGRERDSVTSPITFAEHVLGSNVYPHCQLALKAQERRLIIRFGRLAGNSMTLATKILWTAWLADRMLDNISNNNVANITVISYTIPQSCMIVRNLIQKIQKQASFFNKYIKKDTAKEAEILWKTGKGRTVIRYVSARTGGDEGVLANTHVLAIYLAAHIKDRYIESCISSLEQPHVHIWAASTPSEYGEWFYDRCKNSVLGSGDPEDRVHGHDKEWVQYYGILDSQSIAEHKEYMRQAGLTKADYDQEVLALFPCHMRPI